MRWPICSDLSSMLARRVLGQRPRGGAKVLKLASRLEPECGVGMGLRCTEVWAWVWSNGARAGGLMLRPANLLHRAVAMELICCEADECGARLLL